MKTLQVEISEQDFNKFNFKEKGNLTFNELEQLISLDYAKKSLEKCHEIAAQTGLSEMTIDEINSEILAVRNAKNNNRH